MTYPLRMAPRNRLRELRKRAGLTQIELADRTGVSQSAISQIENDVLPMDTAWMRAFARELECNTADLLADEDNPDRLDEAERELINRFRAATLEQRALIARVAEPLQAFNHDNGNGGLKRVG
jgi:transcriptional regulator with XRE-family HTH domain